MMDKTDFGEHARSGLSDAPAYEVDELRAIGIPARILTVCDQIGLAVLRVDDAAPALSHLAEVWIGGETDIFMDSSAVSRARTTTDPGAQWDYTCLSGRVVRLRRVERGQRLWLIFHDVTLYSNHDSIMKDMGEMGMGYVQFSLKANRLRMFGDFLDNKLSPNEQLEVRRSQLRSLIHPRDRDRFESDFAAITQTGEPLSAIYECQSRRESSFRISLSLRAVRNATGEVCKVLGSFRDVTGERMAQAELIRLQNEHSANDEARQFMVSRIVHEVRTPLSGILGMADVLLRGAEQDDVRKQLTILRNAALDSISLLTTLSGTSSDTDGMDIQAEPTDIVGLVEQAVGLWTPRAQENGTDLTLRIREGGPSRIIIDGRRLRQCLTNILSNAVKFTKGGRVQVAMALVENAASPRLVIAVRDNGIGMSETEQTRLFQPFVQANPQINAEYGGSGLGMSITHGLVARMGGTLDVQSEKGVGTTIVLNLPFESAGELTESTHSADLVETLLATTASPPTDFSEDLRVLIVDDNETNRVISQELLRPHVRHIDLADNGREAIQRLDAQDYDLVLMDIHMPIMDGIETTLAIRSSGAPYSDIPIVALTADEDYQNKRVTLNIGMDAAMAKPLSIDRLLSVIEQLGLMASPRHAA